MNGAVLVTDKHDDYIVFENGAIYKIRVERAKERPNGSGYQRVKIGGRERFVHKLVADAFLGSPVGDATEVDHIDGNILNNSVDNLRYVSHSENMRNIHKHATMRKPRRCLSAEERNAILHDCVKHDFENGVRALARKYGVDAKAIRLIVNKKMPEGGECND